MGLALNSPDIARSSAFRAFRSQVRDAFMDYQSPFISIDVLLTWGTSKFGSVQVRHEPRYAGKSNYTLGKLVHYTFSRITSLSTFPLRLSSIIGFVFTALGFLVLVYVIAHYLFIGSPVEGFTFLASIIALFSGVQLFAMGIFGEYLARMYSRMMGRPPSVTREMVGFQPRERGSDD